MCRIGTQHFFTFHSSFRICIHVHSLLIISMSSRKLFSSWTLEWKSFVLSNGRKNSCCSVAMCFNSFITSFNRMGTLCARNVWTWVKALNNHKLRRRNLKDIRMNLFHKTFVSIILSAALLTGIQNNAM